MSTVSVEFDAKVAGLLEAYSQAKVGAQDLQKQLDALNRTAQSSGMNDELKAKIDAVSLSLAVAKGNVRDLNAEMKALAPTGRTITESFAGLQRALGAIGIGIGVVELAKGFKDLAMSAEEFGLSNAKFAAELGISESSAAALGMALKAVGVSSDDYATMAMRMEMRLKTSEAAFRSYGMATRDANGELLNGNALMMSAISAMEQYRAGTDQNEFALDVFGRKASEIYDIIRANTTLQAEAAKILQEFGLQTTGAGNAAEQLEEKLAVEKMQFEAMELAVSAKLMPTMTAFISWCAGSGAPVLQGLATVLKVVASAVIIVATTFLESARIIAGAVTEVVEMVTGMAHVVVDVFKGDFVGALEDGKAAGLQMGSTFMQVTGDIADDARKAGAAIKAMFSDSQSGDVNNPFVPKSGDKSFTEYNKKAAEDAQRTAQRIVEINKQTDDAVIAGKEQANQSAYDLGQESLEQFTAQELQLAKQKYDADLAALQGQLATKKINYAEYVAEKNLLDTQYANNAARIAEQSAAKEQQINQQAMREFITDRQSELQSGMASYEEQYRAGAISADQKAALESALTDKIQKEIDDQLEFEEEAYSADSKAYAALEAEKLKIDKEFAAKHDGIVKQQVSDDKSAYDRMLAPFNSALSQMLQGTKSFASIGYDLLDKMIMNVITGIEKMVISWVISEKTKTAATVTGNAARTASNVSGATASGSAEFAADSKSIMGSAATSASEAYKSVMQSVPPPFNLAAAPIAAAGVFTAVMAFGDNLPSFAAGSANIPHDMLANVHAGEMIIPSDISAGLRGAGIGPYEMKDISRAFASGGVPGSASFASSVGNTVGGNDVALHYHPTINSREPATLGQMLSTHGHEMHAWIRREFRNGALKP